MAQPATVQELAAVWTAFSYVNVPSVWQPAALADDFTLATAGWSYDVNGSSGGASASTIYIPIYRRRRR